MFSQLRQKNYVKKHFKVGLPKLFIQLEDIRRKSEVLTICPSTTDNSWQGVFTATINLFPDSTFKIPQYFSNCIYTNHELKLITIKIVELKFDKVIFSGYCSYFSKLILNINHNYTYLKVFLIHLYLNLLK